MTDDQILLIAAADGIEQFDEYLNILRQHADDLESQGIAYEEQDRRAGAAFCLASYINYCDICNINYRNQVD